MKASLILLICLLGVSPVLEAQKVNPLVLGEKNLRWLKRNGFDWDRYDWSDSTINDHIVKAVKHKNVARKAFTGGLISSSAGLVIGIFGVIRAINEGDNVGNVAVGVGSFLFVLGPISSLIVSPIYALIGLDKIYKAKMRFNRVQYENRYGAKEKEDG